MPRRYRVVARGSAHEGDVGMLLDKAEARRRCAERGLLTGRSPQWYASWDVLLEFVEGSLGTGFRWDEIEVVVD